MSQRARTMTDRSVTRGGVERDPVLVPAAGDELLHGLRHLDLGRPLTGALGRRLRRRVDTDLSADELERRRVIEMIERPFRQQDVSLRVDVGADVEEDLLVV